ncbi:MAG: hypothetical protein AAGI52_03170 [Bacteroidota bacterium]
MTQSLSDRPRPPRRRGGDIRGLVVLALAVLMAIPASVPASAQGTIDRDHVPSDERVNLFQRRQTNLDANTLRTTVFNFGQTGRTGAVAGEIPYEWPRNTRRHYIALTGLFTGAEVIGESGEREYIVNVPNYRENQNDPNQAWTWAPISGYVNTADEDLGIARSDRPESWPSFWPDKLEDPTDPGWPGSWSGLFGKNVFNADLEVFYKMGDDEYAKPTNTYYPDETDRTRRGLGLIADTRVLAWSQILIDDVAFILHRVQNDGTQDLTSVGVTLWLADLVGGDPDARDDRPFFDLLLDTAFLTDADGRSSDVAFEGVDVEGAIAFFLETPGNAVDRIDNDGDGTTLDEASDINGFGESIGEPGSPIITLDLLEGEGDQSGNAGRRLRFDGIDNNGNGLIDEDSSRAAFGTQVGVGFADYIDNDGDGEPGSPVVTQEMIDLAAGDRWQRWPIDPNLSGGEQVHLLQLGAEDLGRGFRDGIDNDDDASSSSAPANYLWEPGSPVVTQAMVDAAASDAPYFRFRVPDTDIVLYDVTAADLGLPYADGVDNDEDGAVDEGIDEGIDEMIDERRNDGIDNDGDWRPSLDDVGLDGSDLTGDSGENDGVPTSGAGTTLPGEPNIDVTDISESDQIGITNVRYRPAGGINYQSVSDGQLFFDFLVPGQFTLLTAGGSLPAQDNDLFVSSGIFPLRAGQTESVSFAVIMGDVDYGRPAIDVEGRYRDLLDKRQNAQEAYEADYRFAQAPVCPQVRAVPGDGNVTLYWDNAAENSFDSFIADLATPGLDPFDFEGYRVYRSTDPGFLDARTITDGFGNISFLRPIAQYDLINGNEGFHPTPVNGTQFFLGSDTRDAGEAANGLSNVYVDDSAVNGITYYYAVTSYDFGAALVNIPPSECAISITIGPDGAVQSTGPNVVVATPSQSAGGRVDMEPNVDRVQGFGSGSVGYEVIDPTVLQDGHRYRVSFRDTVITGLRGNVVTQDTFRTQDVSLFDLTDNQPIFENELFWLPRLAAPITEGFRLGFDPVTFTSLDQDSTGWASDEIQDLIVRRFSFPGNDPGTRFPSDYRIEIGAPGSGQAVEFDIAFGSTFTIPAKPTNFRVFKQVIGADGQPAEVPVQYAFLDGTGEGSQPFGPGSAAVNLFSSQRDINGTGVNDSDRIFLLENIPGDGRDGLAPTWELLLDVSQASRRLPQPGDTGSVITVKPFLAGDVFEFTVNAPQFDAELATSALDRVRVVPNPYRGASQFETANPFPTGRGERQIRFTNLPPRATVRIFTASGRLVKTLQMDQGSNDSITPDMLLNGSIGWDLLNESNLEVAYGVYLFHVDAPGVGETTGTFAIIK